MKIPKYWAMSVRGAQEPGGRWLRLACWGWSDMGPFEARTKAEERTAELARKVEAGMELGRYAYGERPVREEILEGVTNYFGSEVAIVTRNQYGARVLNAANAMFIDIDIPGADGPATLARQLQNVLRAGAGAGDRTAAYVQRITAWVEQHPGLGMRVYRTRAGLRCLVTNQVFDPAGPESTGIMQALGSDPLYVTLCRAQGCFRARLTPKPWRCGLRPPPGRYPWDNFKAETRYRGWERQYEHHITDYAVCRLVAELGSHDVHPDVAPVLALHDEVACPPGERPLA